MDTYGSVSGLQGPVAQGPDIYWAATGAFRPHSPQALLQGPEYLE